MRDYAHWQAYCCRMMHRMSVVAFRVLLGEAGLGRSSIVWVQVFRMQSLITCQPHSVRQEEPTVGPCLTTSRQTRRHTIMIQGHLIPLGAILQPD